MDGRDQSQWDFPIKGQRANISSFGGPMSSISTMFSALAGVQQWTMICEEWAGLCFLETLLTSADRGLHLAQEHGLWSPILEHCPWVMISEISVI